MTIRVPNTNTFNLQNVVDAVEDHTGENIAYTMPPNDKKDLSDCFERAIEDYFDSNFDTASYAPENSMLRFRNYGPRTGSCGSSNEYNGGHVWPYTKDIDLGTKTGNTKLYFNAYSLPDLIQIYWNDNLVLTTGFRGHSDWDYGGSERLEFKQSLYNKIDPVTGVTFPNYTYYPDDGYPRVFPNSTEIFNKGGAYPETVRVKVWGPMPTTAWRFHIECL